MARILVYRGDQLLREIELSEFDFGKQDVGFGRSEENEVVLEDPEKVVSRRHAELRFKNGQYEIFDLGTQNGTWIGGDRIQHAVVPPGVPVMIGPYQILLEEFPDQASRMAETVLGGEPPVPEGTVLMERPPDPSTEEGVGGPRQTRPAAGQSPATQPGVVAWLARQPKPVILGGFLTIVILIIAAGAIFSPSEETDLDQTADQATTQAPFEPTPSEPTNETIVAALVADAQAHLDRGESEAAVGLLDRALLVDRSHPEVIELRSTAEEVLKQQLADEEKRTAAATDPTPDPVAEEQVPPTVEQMQRREAELAQRAADLARETERRRRAEEERVSLTVEQMQQREAELAQRAADLARETELRRRYDEARAAMDAREYQTAIRGLEGILQEQPRYRDVADLLSRAQNGLATLAQEVFDEALEAEGNGEWEAAIAGYERARELDDSIVGIDDVMRRAWDSMEPIGDDAYARARQYDALGRIPEAIALYERAVRMFAPYNPNRSLAQARLTEISPRSR
ncbi:MAG: FHA domain-containing protein [Vicinamibacterales bacterium]|jgi:tetratricopeptide (TPR) repeat protein|nr:FHA domain-containing protein [Vicinamibacterales bacterium]HJN45331.1 FHA domain-containing protein [Vicinamibacterales bacterium]|tara:strand:+ start:5740 stop:7284 length:1545 start_codon:yes stop_codon:yes gene_type:complete